MVEDNTSFLVDIGTNGEMVLWHDKKIYCCSTAAGPVFEGANISHGMMASSGAINKVYIEDGEVCYTTIDNVKATGICGTGIIDAVSCMLKLGVIDETGYLEKPFQIGDSQIYITAEDIRKVQLGKSAIKSGIDTLLHETNNDINSIEHFYIAGGFGSYINTLSAINIGLIPKEVKDKVIILGNASGIGASMMLCDKSTINYLRKIAQVVIVVELSFSEFFKEQYIVNMFFPKV